MNAEFHNITMTLYETDIELLRKFIATEDVENEITKGSPHLVLFNFMEDCRYSESIQSDLIVYLLPFYLHAARQYTFYNNEIAEEIYNEFNSALFANHKHFKSATGNKNYEKILSCYTEMILKKMEEKERYTLDWVSISNTTIAFDKENIVGLFDKIFNASPKIKLAFFEYLSVLLFKESDNLLVTNPHRTGWTDNSEGWTDNIWDFDGDEFFWSDDIIEYFSKEINESKIKRLYTEIYPLLYTTHETETIELLEKEMCSSLSSGLFDNRKAEFLEKMNCVNKDSRYWYNY